MRTVRVMVAIAVMFGVGWAAGGTARMLSSSADRPRPSTGLEQGALLPNPVVHLDDGMAVPLTQLLSPRTATVIIMFSTYCSSCAGEAATWQQLAAKNHIRFEFIGLANTPDVTYLRALAQQSAIRFPLYRINVDFPRQIGAMGLPTVYVISPERHVLFSAAGVRATAELEDWLSSLEPQTLQT